MVEITWPTCHVNGWVSTAQRWIYYVQQVFLLNLHHDQTNQTSHKLLWTSCEIEFKSQECCGWCCGETTAWTILTILKIISVSKHVWARRKNEQNTSQQTTIFSSNINKGRKTTHVTSNVNEKKVFWKLWEIFCWNEVVRK